MRETTTVELLIQSIVAPQERDRERRTIGYFCGFVPLELIHAADFVPIRLFETADSSTSFHGDTYMQRNACPFIKACIGHCLSKKYNYLEGVVVSHTCDGMRGMAENFAYFPIAPNILFTLDIPRNNDRPNNIKYFRTQLEGFKKKLEEISGSSLSSESILQSTDLYSDIREQLTILRNLSNLNDNLLNNRVYYQILHQVMTGDPETYRDILHQIVRHYTDHPTLAKGNLRVMLSGSIIPKGFTNIIDIITQNNATIVADYACTGSRYNDVRVDKENPSILDALTDAYYRRSHCARMYPLAYREDYIRETIKNKNVQAVIHYALKFCDTYLYETTNMKRLCRRMGVPFLALETDLNQQDFGQLNTRIQSFFEGIRG